MDFHRVYWSGPKRENYMQKVQAIAPANLIALWPLNELSGTTALDQSGNRRNGTYATDSGSFTLGQTGIGDGGTAPLFDPAIGTRIDLFSTIASVFNGQEGTMSIWFKVRAASVLSDGSGRMLWKFAVDGANQTYISRTTVNNQYQFIYKAGNVLLLWTFTDSAVTWQNVVMTWSLSGNAAKGFVNGAQSGATQTGLGTWSGTPISGNCGISQGGPTWDGYLALAALWNTPLNQTQITALATVP